MASVSKSIVSGIVAAVALIGASSAAFAGGDVGKPAISSSWSGFYVGGSAGYGWGDSTVDFRPSFPDNASPSIDGPVFGLHAGIQHQSGRIVAGIDVTLLKSGISGTATDVADPTVEMTAAIDRLIMLNGKLGVTIDNSLLYITGGYAFGTVSSHTTQLGAPTNFIFGHDKADGWNLGAGIEYRISNTVVAGLEYRHIDLGSIRVDGFNSIAVSPASRAHDLDFTADIVTARVTILLGRGDSAPSKPMK